MTEEKNRSIKSWAPDDRPREKLLLKGPAALSDAELLSILIGSGNEKYSAIELARQILQTAQNNWHQLARLNASELQQIKGIGEVKAITIMACMEISRRRLNITDPEAAFIRSSADAFKQLQAVLSDLVHEEFWVLYLNRGNRLICRERISSGGISGTVTDLRIIFKKAIQQLASVIILAHNHPSGNRTPSQADIQITQKAKEAARLLDIQLADHIIVAGREYYSFADEGNL